MTWCDKASKSRFLHRITTKVKSFISAVLIDYTKLGLKHRIMEAFVFEGRESRHPGTDCEGAVKNTSVKQAFKAF
jgi:hypothetical protein